MANQKCACNGFYVCLKCLEEIAMLRKEQDAIMARRAEARRQREQMTPAAKREMLLRAGLLNTWLG